MEQLQGVTFDGNRGTYKARIFFSGQERFIGRYKSSEEAALAYDQAARYVNSKLSEGPEHSFGPSGRKTRTRPLNFPSMCPNDPQVERRLKLIFRDAEAKPDVSGTTAVSCQSEQAGDEQDPPRAVFKRQAADQASAGPPAAPRSRKVRTAVRSAAHTAAAVAAAAAGTSSALRTAVGGRAGPAAAIAASPKLSAEAAGALRIAFPGADVAAGTTPPAAAAAAAAAALPALVAGTSPTLRHVAGAARAEAAPAPSPTSGPVAAGAEPGPDAVWHASPAGSRAGSCKLPESAAASAHAAHNGAHAGTAGGSVPELEQHAQGEQQQLRRLAAGPRSPAPAQPESAGAGAGSPAAVIKDQGHLGSGPAGSRVSSCELPESAAAPAQATQGAHAGSPGAFVPQLQQKIQGDQQQLRSLAAGPYSLAPGQQEYAGARFPAAAAEGQGRSASCSVPQQQLQVQPCMPEVPDFQLGSRDLSSLPLLNSLEDKEWRQLLSLLEGGVDGTHAEGLSAGKAAGGAGCTAAAGIMGMQQGHAASDAHFWRQHEQFFGQQEHSTHHGAHVSRGSHCAGGDAGSAQKASWVAQCSRSCGDSSSLVSAGRAVSPFEAAATACAVRTGADAAIGAFGSAAGAHAAATALTETAEPLVPLLACSGTAQSTAFSGADAVAMVQPGSWFPAIAGAAGPAPAAVPSMAEPAGLFDRPTQSLSHAAMDTGAGQAAAATAGVGGLFSCVRTPHQALPVIGRVLQGLEDLGKHLQQHQAQQWQQQYAGMVSCHPQQQFAGTVSCASSPLGPVLDWLQAAWYIEASESIALPGASPPGIIAAAISAAKAARPAVNKPHRLALLLLEQLAVVCSNTLAAAAEEGADVVGVAAHNYVCAVLWELQQVMAAMQRFVATTPAGAEIDCAQLLEAYVDSKYLPGSPDSGRAVAEILWRLAQLL